MSVASPDFNRRPFAERIRERRVGPCRLLTLPTPVRDVVSWEGSVRTNPDFAGGEELVQRLAVALLDKGTRRRDRFAIAEVLENRGAELHFSAEKTRIECAGRALRADVPEVLRVMAEQLREPLMDPDEFEKARAQVEASLKRALESTGAQASTALARRIYPEAHPNYARPTPELLEHLGALTLDEVRAYHDAHVGSDDFTLAVVGDVDETALEDALREAFADWPARGVPAQHQAEAVPREPGRSGVPMPDKMNVDVRMGHAVPVRRQDADYVPLYLANYVLGGNFSARLMTTIRDEQGLTYGIGSALSGITTDCQGHWQVNVTLSQENLARGLEATTTEVRRFVQDGITADELRDKQTTVVGAYKVGLATTRSLASVIHLNAQRGFGRDYLDRFPEEVEAVTLEQAHEVIRRYLDPDRLQIALAGMLPEAVES